MADAKCAGRSLQELVHGKRPLLGLGRVDALVVVDETRRIGAAGGNEGIVEPEVQHLDNAPWGHELARDRSRYSTWRSSRSTERPAGVSVALSADPAIPAPTMMTSKSSTAPLACPSRSPRKAIPRALRSKDVASGAGVPIGGLDDAASWAAIGDMAAEQGRRTTSLPGRGCRPGDLSRLSVFSSSAARLAGRPPSAPGRTMLTAMTHDASHGQRVSASRQIHASAADVFRLVADPAGTRPHRRLGDARRQPPTPARSPRSARPSTCRWTAHRSNDVPGLVESEVRNVVTQLEPDALIEWTLGPVGREKPFGHLYG